MAEGNNPVSDVFVVQTAAFKKTQKNNVRTQQAELIGSNNDSDKCERTQPMNQHQKNFLISYMASHDHFAKSHITELSVVGSHKKAIMWQKLAEQLNEKGPSRTALQWANAWKTMRLNAKNAKIDYVRAFKKTGNKSRIKPLTSDQELICGIFNNFGLNDICVQQTGFTRSEEKAPLTKPNKRQKVSPHQKKYLITFMHRNKINAFVKSFKDCNKVLWEKIMHHLNNLKGCTKSSEQWFEYWASLLRKDKSILSKTREYVVIGDNLVDHRSKCLPSVESKITNITDTLNTIVSIKKSSESTFNQLVQLLLAGN